MCAITLPHSGIHLIKQVAMQSSSAPPEIQQRRDAQSGRADGGSGRGGEGEQDRAHTRRSFSGRRSAPLRPVRVQGQARCSSYSKTRRLHRLGHDGARTYLDGLCVVAAKRICMLRQHLSLCLTSRRSRTLACSLAILSCFLRMTCPP